MPFQIPEVKHLEPNENASEERITHPFRVAARNSGIALAALAAFGLAFVFRIWRRGDDGTIYWWIWPTLGVFVVFICFAHAFLGARWGGSKASAFLKVVVILTLIAALTGLWWHLQPNENGGI